MVLYKIITILSSLLFFEQLLQKLKNPIMYYQSVHLLLFELLLL